jgi:hypothetical protein
MAQTPEAYRGRRRLRALLELALSEGWIVCSDEEGIRLVKPGLPPVWIGTPQPLKERGKRNE